MEKYYPKRKENRKPYHNYSSPGAYFVTVCTKNRLRILSAINKKTVSDFPYVYENEIVLTDVGTMLDSAVNNISKIYQNVKVDSYVIMPNHIHIIIMILPSDDNSSTNATTSLGTIIAKMKEYVTKNVGYSIWQKLYHDHIIRTKEELYSTRRYLFSNPGDWADGTHDDDAFYLLLDSLAEDLCAD